MKLYITVGSETAEKIDNWDDGRHTVDGNETDDAEGFKTGIFTRDDRKTKIENEKSQFGYAVDLSMAVTHPEQFTRFKNSLSGFLAGQKENCLKNRFQLDMAGLIDTMERPDRFTVYLFAGGPTITEKLERIFPPDVMTEDGTFGDPAKKRMKVAFDPKNITGNHWDALEDYLDAFAFDPKTHIRYTDDRIFQYYGPDYFNLYLFAKEVTSKPRPQEPARPPVPVPPTAPTPAPPKKYTKGGLEIVREEGGDIVALRPDGKSIHVRKIVSKKEIEEFLPKHVDPRFQHLAGELNKNGFFPARCFYEVDVRPNGTVTVRIMKIESLKPDESLPPEKEKEIRDGVKRILGDINFPVQESGSYTIVRAITLSVA